MSVVHKTFPILQSDLTVCRNEAEDAKSTTEWPEVTCVECRAIHTLAEVLEMFLAGGIPAHSISEFADLHDYCDANVLAGMDELDNMWTNDYEAIAGWAEEYRNKVQSRVAELLKDSVLYRGKA